MTELQVNILISTSVAMLGPFMFYLGFKLGTSHGRSMARIEQFLRELVKDLKGNK